MTSGYREHNYDQNAYERLGRPSRPFNAVQWLGVALIVLGVGFNLAFLAGEAGWLPKFHIGPAIGISPLVFGIILMNSRREPVQDLAPELAGQRRRWMIIVTSVCGIILGAATIAAIAGA